MLKDFLTYLKFGNQYCGIEHTTVNGDIKLFATLLKKTKREIDVSSSLQSSSIKDIVEKLPKKQHVFLIVNNKQVLTKVIESKENDNLRLVHKAFPNINLDEFYYEVLHQKELQFISLCRKEYINDLIEQYKKENVFVVSFTLGNSIIKTIKGFVNLEDIFTSNSQIKFTENEMSSINYIENNKSDLLYDINGLKANNIQILSLAGALGSVLNNNQLSNNFENKQHLLLSEYKQMRFFNQFIKAGLVLILGLLMVNFMFFNYYFNKVNDLQQTSEINQISKQKIVNLSKRVGKTQKMVDDMLKSTSSKSSFFSNAIIQSLQSTIVLSKLNYQPLVKRIKVDKDIVLDDNIILVSGVSSDSELFSHWITELEANKWLDKLEIITYGDISKQNSKFTIKLKIAND